MLEETIDFNYPKLFLKLQELCLKHGVRYSGIHIHKETEIARVISGELILYTEDGGSETLTAGDILTVNAYTPHELHAGREQPEIMLLIVDLGHYLPLPYADSSKSFYAFKSRGKGGDVRILRRGSGEAVSAALDGIIRECRDKRMLFDQAASAYLRLLTTELCRNGILYTDAPTDGTDDAVKSIMPAVAYMDENFQRPLTLSEISRAVSLEKSYFCKRFHAVSGGTVTEYLNFLRVRRAALLLSEDGGIKLTELAKRCGFTSCQYFDRIFRRFYGCTPSEFRSRIIKGVSRTAT